jgi:hypothetical protein
MDNAQKHNICTNVPSSETFRTFRPLSRRSLTDVREREGAGREVGSTDIKLRWLMVSFADECGLL